MTEGADTAVGLLQASDVLTGAVGPVGGRGEREGIWVEGEEGEDSPIREPPVRDDHTHLWSEEEKGGMRGCKT